MTNDDERGIEGLRLSEEAAQRIARAITAEIRPDTQYFVVLVSPNGPAAFLAEFPPDDVAAILRDVADDVEAQNRELHIFDVKNH